MPQIDLYGPADTPYTVKCLSGLRLKGLPFTLHEPSGPEDYKRWNPKTGLLPAMRVDGELVIDSTDILLRIDQIQPDPPLLSRDPQVAEQQLSLEDWADESFLYYFQRWMQLVAEQPEPKKRRGPRALRALGAWLAAGGTWERPQAALLRGIDDRLADLVNFLGSRRFFYADQVSIADLGVYAMLLTLRSQFIEGTGPLLARQPSLLAFMERVEKATEG
ncbi:MAG: glutathione S-transferase family protein [Deltaproteobacteria bacterium]|nr:glutathione S-transferase family protein [Deltaproteobacteria bacterium]MBW2362810.1 glutathione S-transferase family protein [Deltaproteobacteria bacterium]